MQVQAAGSAWTVTVENPVEGGQVHYTVDGTYPTIYSPSYHGPVTVRSKDAFKAMAVAADGKHHSLVCDSATVSTP